MEQIFKFEVQGPEIQGGEPAHIPVTPLPALLYQQYLLCALEPASENWARNGENKHHWRGLFCLWMQVVFSKTSNTTAVQ
jgi:hypothetical protein